MSSEHMPLTGAGPTLTQRPLYAERDRSMLQHRSGKSSVSRVKFPFFFYSRGNGNFSVWPGTVNEFYPTLDGASISNVADPPKSKLKGAGTSYYYLVCTLEKDTTKENFGDFAKVGEGDGVPDIKIEHFTARQTTPALWYQPRLCLCRAEVTGSDEDGYAAAFYNEVFSSLQLIQFFDRYIFMPYFVPSEFVGVKQATE